MRLACLNCYKPKIIFTKFDEIVCTHVDSGKKKKNYHLKIQLRYKITKGTKNIKASRNIML